MVVTGDGLTTDRSCLVAFQPTNPSEDFEQYTKEWDVSTTSVTGDGAVFDCSSLPAGVHLIVLKVTNSENIVSTQAVNIVRLPADELTVEEQEALPSQSFGEETATEDVGWYTIGVLGLIVAIVVFVLLVQFEKMMNSLHYLNLVLLHRFETMVHLTLKDCLRSLMMMDNYGVNIPTVLLIGGIQLTTSGKVVIGANLVDICSSFNCRFIPSVVVEWRGFGGLVSVPVNRN